MNNKNKNSVLYIITALLVLMQYSCFKDEKLYPMPSQVITGKIDTLDMGENFEKKYFYDLETNKITETIHKDWDLALGSHKYNTLVKLNGVKKARIFKTELKSMEENYDPKNVKNWTYHHESNKADSIAIKDWCFSGRKYFIGHGQIYLLDRGEKHLKKRYYLFRLILKDSANYEIDVRDITSKKVLRLKFKTDPMSNFTYINIQNKVYVKQEPIKKHQWDLEFTKYFYLFTNEKPALPYLVVGALSNYYKVKVARLANKDYNSITKSIIKNIKFEEGQSVIGFDWKNFNRNIGEYKMVPNLVYIIKNRNGFYFKLRFISYTNKKGNSGYPTFQVEPLK